MVQHLQDQTVPSDGEQEFDLGVDLIARLSTRKQIVLTGNATE